MDWTIAFDGAPHGRIHSASPAQWTRYGDVGIQLITAGQSVPTIGRPDSAFEQWDASGPVYRPLILVSHPFTRDPEGWTRVKTQYNVPKPLALEFCAHIDSENPAIGRNRCGVKAIKAYSSRSGILLVALALAGKPPAEEVPGVEWSPHWFAAAPSAAPRFLGSGLILIDAGDYDGDGHSELVFMESGYDRDGYIMFTDNFTRSVEFAWSYH